MKMTLIVETMIDVELDSEVFQTLPETDKATYLENICKSAGIEPTYLRVVDETGDVEFFSS